MRWTPCWLDRPIAAMRCFVPCRLVALYFGASKLISSPVCSLSGNIGCLSHAQGTESCAMGLFLNLVFVTNFELLRSVVYFVEGLHSFPRIVELMGLLLCCTCCFIFGRKYLLFVYLVSRFSTIQCYFELSVVF